MLVYNIKGLWREGLWIEKSNITIFFIAILAKALRRKRAKFRVNHIFKGGRHFFWGIEFKEV